MNRVLVIGCPGSGKSTFSRALAQKTGLPLFHLDRIYWNADRTTVEKSVFLERLSGALRGSRWIIDGNYGSTLEMRLQACDTVFFLDYPVEVCLDGVRLRRGQPRSDIPWTEIEEDMEFTQFIKNYRVDSRPKVMELLNKYACKQIHTFQNRDDAEQFLNRLHQDTCE